MHSPSPSLPRWRLPRQGCAVEAARPAAPGAKPATSVVSGLEKGPAFFTAFFTHGSTLTSIDKIDYRIVDTSFTSLEWLNLHLNQLTSVPAEIGHLTSLTKLNLSENQLTTLPAEIGQLTSLRELYLQSNQLTSLPAEIGQLMSLEELYLYGNQLTSMPAEIGLLTSLRELRLYNN